ncbi:hypothetical protein WISP_103014 [Willisornis vidua]|uniref:Uncharacterized protein n=1 Tax=Willisornis vidua TaxID=1566151 RepID=A0ABQ9D3T3_9PASS|nr:hypothetical protein WISP_103014 [Willisornis vidua]
MNQFHDWLDLEPPDPINLIFKKRSKASANSTAHFPWCKRKPSTYVTETIIHGYTSVPQAMKTITPNWEQWLISQRVKLPCKWNLPQLEKGANRNPMKLNSKECKALHLGRTNPRHQHVLGATQVGSSWAQKALSVLVDSRMDTSQQWEANGILRCITKSIASRSMEANLLLCPALVRPLLESAKRMEPDSFQWCPVPGSQTMGTGKLQSLLP